MFVIFSEVVLCSSDFYFFNVPLMYKRKWKVQCPWAAVWLEILGTIIVQTIFSFFSSSSHLSAELSRIKDVFLFMEKRWIFLFIRSIQTEPDRQTDIRFKHIHNIDFTLLLWLRRTMCTCFSYPVSSRGFFYISQLSSLTRSVVVLWFLSNLFILKPHTCHDLDFFWTSTKKYSLSYLSNYNLY